MAAPDATENALVWIGQHHGQPKDHLYGIATAPYFGNWGDKVNRTDVTAPQLAQHLLEAARNYNTPKSKTAASQRRFHDMARELKIRSMAYEGGADLGQAPGQMRKEDLPRFVAVRAASQALPLTGEAVAAHFDWWFNSGGQEYFYYKDFSIYNKSGYFGLSNDPTKTDTPKYKAAIAAAKKHRATAGE